MSTKWLRLSVVLLVFLMGSFLGGAFLTFFDYEERFHSVEIDRQGVSVLQLKQSLQAKRLRAVESELRIAADVLKDTRAEFREARASLVTSQTTKEELRDAQHALAVLNKKLQSKISDNEKALAQMTQRVENVSKEIRERDAFVREALTAAQKAQPRDEPLQKRKTMQSSSEIGLALKAKRLLAPTVQIICGREVGSGTIIHSKRGVTYVLTALHVIAHEQTDDLQLIEVKIFSGSGEPLIFSGKLIASSEKIDAAVVRINGKFFPQHVARLASRATLAKVAVFEKIYAIGCPLGYSPMPTSGELSSKTKKLKEQNYWMTSAPTIFGNSGGGIYRAESQELIGFLSRVSAYNNFINIAVPHMGIFVPMSEVYDWMDTEFLTYLYDRSVSHTECERRKTMAIMVGERKEDKGGK